MKKVAFMILIQAAFIGGIMSRPALEKEFSVSQKQDVAGFERVIAEASLQPLVFTNIDEGEFYIGE